MNKILPAVNNDIKQAKKVIDDVIANRSIYVNTNRASKKMCIATCCSPCIFFSFVTRVLSCPFQCMFNPKTGCNPCIACVIDSRITQASDKCICNSCDEVDQKRIVLWSMYNEFNDQIILYAAEKIVEADDVVIKYAITDCVISVVQFMSPVRDITPMTILALANQVRERIHEKKETNNI